MIHEAATGGMRDVDRLATAVAEAPELAILDALRHLVSQPARRHQLRSRR